MSAPVDTSAGIPVLNEISRHGRRGLRFAGSGEEAILPERYVRNTADVLALPEVSELDVVRHFTRLSQRNMSIDTTFYPLGSCTMKYNPKVNEAVASAPGFAERHPLTPTLQAQGSLALMFELQVLLAAVSGMAAVSLQPAAGAQGELAGIMIMRAYHAGRNDQRRTKVLVPDSAHGTNPATVRMAGYDAVQVPSDSEGLVDQSALEAVCGDDVAGLMLTNPNTLGLFERNIDRVAETVHSCGGLVYGDGANLNAILGVLRPGDVGIDIMHFNLHKTFSTPHGGGGPGSGPVGVRQDLADFLPGPIVVADSESTGGRQTNDEVPGESGTPTYRLAMPPKSIGRLKAFHGNFGMMVRAYAYIRMLGGPGLRRVAENAVLNANYLMQLLSDVFPSRFKHTCMHEFVCPGNRIPGVSTMDVAKRLLDYGFHAPTVYFPLIVRDALMVEPTESENRETLEAFSAALHAIAREAVDHPELLHSAPSSLPVSRLDEVEAVKRLKLTWQDAV
jgi:glycine dehydrogenase subunit 2